MLVLGLKSLGEKEPMKKILKVFFIFPIFILLALFGVACEDNSLKSISVVRIETISNNETYTAGYKSGYYKLNMGDVFKVEIKCNPSTYTADDFDWSSSNTHCVVVNKNVLRALNAGTATITVRYKNSNGELIKLSFDVDVNAYAPEITFYNVSNNIEYRGRNLYLEQDLNFKADQDNGQSNSQEGNQEKYVYSFYDVNKRAEISESDINSVGKGIINAGKYKITCTKEGTNLSTTKEITVLQKNLTIAAGSYTYCYGAGNGQGENQWPANVVKESDVSFSSSNNNVFLNGVNGEENVVEYKEYVNDNVGISSNIGSYSVKVKYDIKNEFKNNYKVTTVDGNLNIISKSIIILPRDQIDDEALTYGDSVSTTKYTIFSYITDQNGNWVGAEENFKEDSNKRYVYKLDNGIVNYSSNFVVNPPNYYNVSVSGEGEDRVESVGSQASLNNVRCLDVGDYFYKMNFVALNNNIKIANNFSNVLDHNDNVCFYKRVSVQPRSVVICPVRNQGKVFLQNDPNIEYTYERNMFISGDELGEFLLIDYKETANKDNQNFNANVGKYYYKINNINPNYNISLSNSAIQEEGVDDEEKITFEVTPLTVYAEFNSVVARYVKPNNDGTHTISYFKYYSKDNDNKVEASYRTTIKSLRINNKQIVSNNILINDNLFDSVFIESDSNFNETGKFNFVYKKQITNQDNQLEVYSENFAGVFFRIELSAYDDEQYFVSYSFDPKISFSVNQGESIGNSSGNGENRNYTVELNKSSYLKLNKITIKVYPNEQSLSLTKIYDGTNNIPENFGVGSSSYSYDDLEEDDLTLNNVLKNSKTHNSFNSSVDALLSVEEMGTDVGQYKIKLNEDIECQDDYAYYDFVLDNSKSYYVTVTPRTLVVTPKSNQSKPYGAFDPAEFRFSVSNVPDVGQVEFENVDSRLDRQGTLSRIAGENFGSYVITLGTLNFGLNYIAELDSTPVCFNVEPRRIKVIPVVYSTTYGEDYPLEIAYSAETLDDEGVGTINNRIYKQPGKKDFSGLFSLGKKQGNDYVVVQKIGSYYPAGNYTILQGSFSCSNNYQIDFEISEEANFIVAKRQTIVNFKSMAKNSTDALSTTITNASSEYFETPTNLADYSEYNMDEIVLQASTNVYTVSSFSIKFYKNHIDITDCYDVVLGKDVVYTINVTTIDLVLLNSSRLSNVQEVVYNASSRKNLCNGLEGDDFVLSCQTPGYEVALGTNLTTFHLKYNLGSKSFDSVKYSGSYSVYASLEADDKIVVNYTDNNNVVHTVQFNKTAFDDQQIVDNHILNFTNIAYLNINKANIIYDSSEISFDGNLQYGTSLIPRLKITNANNENIFKGVGEESIVLKDVGNLNYRLLNSIDDLKALDVSEDNQISLTIFPETESVEEGYENMKDNYNSVTLPAYLKVVPQLVEYSGASFVLPNTNSRSCVYNGLNVNASLVINSQDLVNLQDKYQITYSYKRIETIYEDSHLGKIKNYANTSSEELILLAELSANSSISINGLIILYGDKEFHCSESLGQAPINAGFYVCSSTCVLDENYTFISTSQNAEPEGTILTFSTIFEIQKMNNIEVTNWEAEFKYSTKFDFNNGDLPFSYEVSPANLKQKIVYVLSEQLQQSMPVNNKLPVGEYLIGLKINEDNYFYSGSKTFSVTKLDAQIITPSIISYVFVNSENGVTSYLQNIGAILKNLDGSTEKTQFYSEENNFRIEYYKKNDDNDNYSPVSITKKVGDYKLEIEYGSPNGETRPEVTQMNYYGFGEYYFSIIPAQYSGTVTFKDFTLAYNANFTAESFYNYIINNRNIFNIDSTDSTLIKYLYVINPNNLDEVCAIYNENGFNEQVFVTWFKVGLLKLKMHIESEDRTIQTDKTAKANITQAEISIADFLAYTQQRTSQFVYNGYTVYQDLGMFSSTLDMGKAEKGIRFIPEYFSGNAFNDTYGGFQVSYDGNGKYILNYNNNQYIIRRLTGDSHDKYLVIDKLGNEIFSLTYSYSVYSNGNGYDAIADYSSIAPGSYKIDYNIIVGDNYSSSFAYNKRERSYTISKVDTLYVSFSREAKEYNGSNYADINYGYVPKDLVVKNNNEISQTNMNYTLFYVDPNSSNENQGVRLRLSFEKIVYDSNYFGDSNNDNIVRNVGRYKVKITFINNGYNISDYFKKIKVGVLDSGNTIQNSIYTLDLDNGYTFKDTNNIYQTIYEEYLTIILKVDNSNYTQAFTLNGSVTPETIGEDKFLTINHGSNVTINKLATTYFTLTLCDSGKNAISGKENITTGFNFNSLSAGTYYVRINNVQEELCSESNRYLKIVIV